jgi:hypothetical protein
MRTLTLLALAVALFAACAILPASRDPISVQLSMNSVRCAATSGYAWLDPSGLSWTDPARRASGPANTVPSSEFAGSIRARGSTSGVL